MSPKSLLYIYKETIIIMKAIKLITIIAVLFAIPSCDINLPNLSYHDVTYLRDKTEGEYFTNDYNNYYGFVLHYSCLNEITIYLKQYGMSYTTGIGPTLKWDPYLHQLETTADSDMHILIREYEDCEYFEIVHPTIFRGVYRKVIK